MSAVERDPATPAADGTMPPLLPLALLESVRAHDRPRELLDDEDLAASLPRRLGLTGVIETRIRRYEEARRKGRGVPLEEVGDLLRLILRRPDAELILRDAGEWIARRHFAGLPSPAASALRALPRPARAAALRRAVRRMLRRIAGTGTVEMADWPTAVRITGPMDAVADAGGTACALYAAALEELVHLYTGTRPGIGHTHCAARGEPCCEWTIDPGTGVRT